MVSFIYDLQEELGKNPLLNLLAWVWDFSAHWTTRS